MIWPAFWMAFGLLMSAWLMLAAVGRRWPPSVLDVGVAIVAIIAIAGAFAVISSGGLTAR